MSLSVEPIGHSRRRSSEKSLERRLGPTSGPIVGQNVPPPALASNAWQMVRKHRSSGRRLTAPLSDFVSAMRLAIAAFGQGETGTIGKLTPRHIADLMPYMAAPLERQGAESNRILYLGDLSPYSGVVDLLSGAVDWAERHPKAQVEICWAGSGDLQGVLRAQLTPPNLTQSFTQSGATVLAGLVQRCGILAVPSLSHTNLLALTVGMAAGLPVLGNSRCPQVRLLVTQDVTGWLFDLSSTKSISGALETAFTTKAAQLDQMRAATRDRISALCEEHLEEVDRIAWRGPAGLATSGQA